MCRLPGAAAGANDEWAGSISVDWVEPKAVEFAEKHGADLVTKIDETTRSAIQDLVEKAVEEGWSPGEFANQLEEATGFNEDRSMLVARTEVALASNRGESAAFKEMGFEKVWVYDGDCDICAPLDGEIWTLEKSEEEPIGHPNCVRAFSPVPMEDEE